MIRDPEPPRFLPQALLCADLSRDPAQIVAWFVRRWQVEVTCQECRAHRGVETPRPYRPAVAGRFPAGPDRQLGCRWSGEAIARTTPCLLALFSIATLLAARLPARERRQAAASAWYPTPSRSPPSATPSPPSVARSGASRVG